MLISNNLFSKYAPAMKSLPSNRELMKTDLLVDSFVVERNEQLTMYYAPHNEYINPSAEVVIIGITPGWTQMRIAMEEAIEGLSQGRSVEEICRRTKEKARFAGSMQSNLIQMLDELGLPQYLQIRNSKELFNEGQQLLHTTSLLKYPVFLGSQNYSGAHPSLMNNSFLRSTALTSIEEELQYFHNPLIVPLGKTVEALLRSIPMNEHGQLTSATCLWGFPHPSGANGHRHKQFADHKTDMQQILKQKYRKH
ncbi:hypothetical protein JCM16418A_31820 [Paenibacillus pini]|uniref:Uracil-DNA glycosylase-like domain-containing protein n=1 Tax=Paenibacillus pini JCM 16418 TaxID=1236976 RepID=W7YIY7_9BACL|nr:uracil-DNA glycosylase family protein [Paenibacillus pini]GAF08432.1 hypothetical protein JCM16418_2506 [Paenibacillus pini JCM 16418]